MSGSFEIPPWPVYDDDERKAIDNVLRSGKVNYWSGSECREFEQEFAAYHSSKYGIALANGTLALELALRVLGVGCGDEVVVTPRSFFASASCIVRMGATAVFADVDPDTQNITAETVAAVISDKTVAIIAVHLAGWPCEMPAIMELARKRHLFVVEDCAQAHGARIDGRPVGSFGDVSTFSFCQDKIISTAGEGGMLLTNDRDLWSRGWSFKDHGKNWNKVNELKRSPGFRWLHDSFGTNWRMTELQAAVGRQQLRKLDSWLRKRGENADYLRAGLSRIPTLRIPRPASNIVHAYYKFYAFVRAESLPSGWSRDRLLGVLESLGCPGWSGSCPEIYREGAFERDEYPVLANARMLGEQSMMFPVHPTIEKTHLDRIIGAVQRAFAMVS